MPQKRWGAHSSAPWGQTAVSPDGGSDLGGDCCDRSTQRVEDSASTTSSERSSHCGYDTSRDDHVLERHNAVLVLGESLHVIQKLTHIKRLQIDVHFRNNSAVRKCLPPPLGKYSVK